MERTNKNRTNTLDFYKNDDEKESEYVTPGGDDDDIELINGGRMKHEFIENDDEEKEDEYVTAGGPELNDSDDDVINGDVTMGGMNDANDDDDDSDDDVLIG